MKVIGYLVQTERGLEGEPGLFYDYILAGNGLFVRAQSHLIEAVVNIAPAEVRGLQCLREMVRLSKGRIAKSIYDLAISTLLADRYRERYVAVTWEGEYHLKMPPQESSSGGVEYEVLPNTVVDIHSHAAMSAFFSGTDDSDEKGLRIYMVVGRLDTLLPEVELRLGVYGYFVPMNLDEVFDVYPRQ